MNTHPSEPVSLPLSECWRIYSTMRNRVASEVLGRLDDAGDAPGTIDLLLLALFADGHVLLEDFPGSGKSFLCKKLAACIVDDVHEQNTVERPNIEVFKRIQCTPDLLPQDLHSIYAPSADTTKPGVNWKPGPIFAHFLMVDEINRTGPKVQSGLLEAMAERSVSIDGIGRELGDVFFVVATQNPLDQVGTYPLPAAALDRFLFKRTFSPVKGAVLAKVMLDCDPKKPFNLKSFQRWEAAHPSPSPGRETVQTVPSVSGNPTVKVSELQNCQHTIESTCEVHPSLVDGLLLFGEKVRRLLDHAPKGQIPMKPGSVPSPRALQWLIRTLKALAFLDRGLNLSAGAEYGEEPPVAGIDLLPRIAADFLRHRLIPSARVTPEELDTFILKLAKEAVAEIQSAGA